jgi:hypothetical protein
MSGLMTVQKVSNKEQRPIIVHGGEVYQMKIFDPVRKIIISSVI